MSIPSLLGLSGSLRVEASNRKLIREAARLFGECAFVEADLNLPLYDGDVEDRGIPSKVGTLANQVADADAVVISTPEYNKGISGVLKNALDWISRVDGQPWRNKPVALMSSAAGRAGGERGQQMLHLCMLPFRPNLVPGPEFHLARPADNMDASGRLTNESAVKTLTELMGNLRARI
ncbi:MAG: NADPH-dependent FMN reductase [Pseudomonadota bacterium]